MHRSMKKLFDHLVGTGEQRRRHCEAESLSSLEIDNQFEFGRRLHGQLGRILALENSIHIFRRAPKHVGIIHAVGHQAAAGQEKTIWIDGRHKLPGHEFEDQITMRENGEVRR